MTRVSALAPRMPSTRLVTMPPKASSASRTRTAVTDGKATAAAFSSAISFSVVLPPG